MITNYISFPLFISSFIIGLIFVYFLGPDTKNIYVYPSPQTYQNILYKDNAEQCFQFIPKEINCPLNPLNIKTVPIQ